MRVSVIVNGRTLTVTSIFTCFEEAGCEVKAGLSFSTIGAEFRLTGSTTTKRILLKSTSDSKTVGVSEVGYFCISSSLGLVVLLSSGDITDEKAFNSLFPTRLSLLDGGTGRVEKDGDSVFRSIPELMLPIFVLFAILAFISVVTEGASDDFELLDRRGGEH